MIVTGGRRVHEYKKNNHSFSMKLISVFFIVVAFATNTIANTTDSAVIKNIFSGGFHFEGPHYADDESALYWADWDKAYRLNIDTGNITSRKIDKGIVGHIVRVKDYPKLLVVSAGTGLYVLSWDAAEDENLRLLSVVDIGLPDNRCNDGKVDAKGRLWFGTMSKEENETLDADRGTLYMLSKDMQPLVKVKPVSLSNGIAWSHDNKYMFYIDSVPRKVDKFLFDLETGIIRNRTTVFSFEANNVTGFPDGMTIDTDDNLWVACYAGGKVIKIDSNTGKLLKEYKLPVSRVTSVMWGGHNFTTLYVTTSTRGLTAEQKANETQAGSLFTIEHTGSSGYPQHQLIFPNADKY